MSIMSMTNQFKFSWIPVYRKNPVVQSRHFLTSLNVTSHSETNYPTLNFPFSSRQLFLNGLGSVFSVNTGTYRSSTAQICEFSHEKNYTNIIHTSSGKPNINEKKNTNIGYRIILPYGSVPDPWAS
jgi:hypothetical protein